MFENFNKNLGGFILKNNLGGKRSTTADEAEEETLQLQRQRAIDTSRNAREHFFTQNYQTKMSEMLKDMPEDDKAKFDTLDSGEDLVTWYNRTKLTDQQKKM